MIKTAPLFIVTAVMELLGCYLVYAWLRLNGTAWLVIPAIAALAVFAWLLTLHPTASGRVYAAYGAVYVATAFVWLYAVDGITPTPTDWVGIVVTLTGMLIIVLGNS
jgi:small multidrug resistance family-3 protein